MEEFLFVLQTVYVKFNLDIAFEPVATIELDGDVFVHFLQVRELFRVNLTDEEIWDNWRRFAEKIPRK